jgi:stress response protein YsnF
MKSFQQTVRVTIVGLATMALATGCSTSKHATRQQPAPIVTTSTTTTTTPAQGTAMGGTGPSYQTQYGAGQAQAAGQSTNLVIPLQQEQINVGKREVTEGGVQLRKSVKTETASQPVQLRKETVTVERVPANAPGTTAQTGQTQPSQGATALNTPFQQGEMTINLNQEEPTVQTKTVPAGSVVVRKQVTTQPVNVQTQTRREEVQAVPIGNPQNVNISGNLAAPGGAPGTTDQSAMGGGPGMTGQSGGAGGAPITQLSQLTSTTDPSSLAGQQVNLSNVKVQDVLGDRLIAVSSGGGAPIYVKTAEPTSGIKQGQTINLNGTVKAVPQSVTDLGLDQASAQRIQGQPIYVEATGVTPASK